jgi:MerC mercury resistance protein
MIALLPALTTVLQVPEELHLAAFAIALPASGLAMLRGYQVHGTIYPLLLGSIGLAALGLGALAGFRLIIETGLTVTGSLALAAAHLGNWRLRIAVRMRQSPASGMSRDHTSSFR